jgi:hypothetical protein
LKSLAESEECWESSSSRYMSGWIGRPYINFSTIFLLSSDGSLFSEEINDCFVWSL